MKYLKYLYYLNLMLILNGLACHSNPPKPKNTVLNSIQLVDSACVLSIEKRYNALVEILKPLSDTQRLAYLPIAESILNASKSCIDTTNEYYARIRFTVAKLLCDKDSNVVGGLELYRNVFDFRCRQTPRDSLKFYRVAYNQSITMNKYGLYELARQYSDTAIAYAVYLSDTTRAWIEKANALYGIHDFDGAYFYAQLAFKADSAQNQFQAILHNLSGNIYLAQKDTNRAIRTYQAALRWYEQTKDVQGSAHPLNNLGILYRGKRMYDSADLFLTKAYHILKKGQDSIKMANAMMELAHTQAARNKRITAFQYYQTAISIFGNRKHPYKTECFNGIGDLYLNQNQLDSAFFYYEKSIHASILDYGRKDTLKSPELLLALAAKARVLVLQKAYSPALKTYQVCDQLIEHLQMFYHSDKSIFLLSEKTRSIYTEAIDLAHFMKDKNAFLAFLKNSKAVGLRQILRDAKAKAELPEKELQKEAYLRTQIVSLQRALTATTDTSTAEKAKIKAYSDSLLQTQYAWNQFITNLEKNYKKYFELKWQSNRPVSLQEVQSKLAEDQIFVEYFLADTVLYCLGLTRNKQEILKIQLPKDFKSMVYNFYKASFQLEPDWATYNELSEKAYLLYQLLLEKMLMSLDADKQKTRLLLIPDEELNLIAFDVLTSRRFEKIVPDPKYPTIALNNISWLEKDAALLLNQYAITTSFAHDIFAEYHATQRATNFLGGFFQDYKKTKEQKLVAPAEWMDQLQQIKRFKNGNFYCDEFKNGTKSDFLKNAKNFEMLVLSMHGRFDDKNPAHSGLTFVKNDTLIELLTISEIASMQLDGNELILLGACQTAKGQVQKGEGIISLSRAFAASGSKSLIASLSDVEVRPAHEIMIAFLKNINKGMSKDVALQKAKQDYRELYLKKDRSLTAPCYWAPLTLIGDSSPIPMNSNYGLLLWIPIGIVVIYWVLRFWNKYTFHI